MPIFGRETATAPLRIVESFLPLPLDEWNDIGASTLTLTRGGWGVGTKKLASTASNNNALTHTLERSILLPHNTSAVGDISTARGEVAGDADHTLVVSIRRTGTPATSLQLAAEAYKSDGEAGVGSNLVDTSAVNLLSDTLNDWVEHEFNIDGSGGLAGADELHIMLRCVNNDTGGSGGGTIEIGKTYLKINKRGGQ